MPVRHRRSLSLCLIALLASCAAPPPSSPEPPSVSEPQPAPEPQPKVEPSVPPPVAPPVQPVPQPPAVAPSHPVPEVAAEKPPPAPFTISFEPASGGTSIEIPVPVADPRAASDLAIRFDLAGIPCSLARFAPSGVVEDRFAASAPGQEAFPALRLSIEAGGQRSEQWVVPGSRARGRLYLRAAILECLPVLSSEAFAETIRFLEELYDGQPKIVVELKRGGARHVLPAAQGERLELSEPPYTVEVLRRVNHYARDSRTKEVLDQSPHPTNPAVLVRAGHGEQSRTVWLFSQLPEFSQRADDEIAGLRFVWAVKEHPHPRAEVFLFDAPEGPFPVAMLVQGEFQRVQLDRSGSLQVGGMSLRVEERLPAATVVQKISDDPAGRPAVLLRFGGEGGSVRERWLAEGAAQEIAAGGERFTALLVPSGSAPHAAGFHR